MRTRDAIGSERLMRLHLEHARLSLQGELKSASVEAALTGPPAAGLDARRNGGAGGGDILLLTILAGRSYP